MTNKHTHKRYRLKVPEYRVQRIADEVRIEPHTVRMVLEAAAEVIYVRNGYQVLGKMQSFPSYSIGTEQFNQEWEEIE
jgi:hypothetical protein